MVSAFRPTSLSTLGDLKNAGFRIYGNCYCGHGRELDLEMLIKRYGVEYVFINEERNTGALVCTRCGQPGGRLTLQPR